MNSQDKIAMALLKENQMRNDKDHEEIKKSIADIKDLVDEALKSKADKSEVSDVKQDIDKLKSWIFYSVIGGIIVFAILQGLEYIKNFK